MIIRDDVTKVLIGGKKALLINPPVYDTQYWAYWAQPHGLLKVATWLRRNGYTDLRLIDCLATDDKRHVHFHVAGDKQRGNITRKIRVYGMPLHELRGHLQEHANNGRFRPDEIWITSIMTYWWESTRDVVRLVREVFGKPAPRILVGGIYPTLCPEHANANLRQGTDLNDDELVIVDGEITPDAANAWTDLSLYNDAALYEVQPRYSLITGSRGCPFNCDYCAQQALNHGKHHLRFRSADDIAEEMAQKQRDFGIREFAFYEDNLLCDVQGFRERLNAIRQRKLKVVIHAPEGIEPRLVNRELATEMHAAGFEKVYLALETIDNSVAQSWGRKQATIEKFAQAVKILEEAGYRIGNQDINAFVLFGLPDEDLQAVINTAVYASIQVGSVVPMLFTPVPGSQMFLRHREYLEARRRPHNKAWGLEDLNGKLFPFLEYNQRKYRKLKASDYIEIESLMMHLNSSKTHSKRFNINSDNQVARAFRRVLSQTP